MTEHKYSEAVQASVAPSRWAVALLVAALLATLALLLAMPGEPWLRGMGAITMLLATRDALRVTAWRVGRRGIRFVHVDRTQAIEVVHADGQRLQGTLRAGSFVAPWLTIVRWRPEGARFDRTFVLLPDMLDRESFRRLRVLLRWGYDSRSPPIAGAAMNAMRTAFQVVFATWIIAAGWIASAASVAPVAAENGMVATAQHLATKVGVDVLKRGGNAVDAAVAVGYALAVVYPAAGNLGGGGFMTIQFADGRKTFLDFREKAPLAATRDMYLDAQGNVIKGLSTYGHLAVGVPGSVHGLEMAREKYGTRSRGELIAPAITLAEKGFVLEQGDVDMFRNAIERLRQDPPSNAIFGNNGKPWEAGQRLVQKDLANTLRLIAKNGANGFYKGPVGAKIVRSSAAGKGILTQADLDNYSTREMKPVECDYRGYGIVSAPPPSSGGVIVCEILNILEGYPLKDLGFRSAQAVHYQIEAMRHAYMDRNSYLGDPEFVKNPTERLLDKAYAEKIRGVIDPARAGVSMDIKPGTPPHEGSNTTHFSIMDKDGNAVAVTYTINEWFGACVTAEGTGVLLNNEMDDFTVKAGVPNLFGLVQGEANAIAPGKRPLSSMSPTIMAKDGKPVLIVGTPGGSRIITVVVHTILNLVDYGMNLQEAVDATRFHQQWLPETTAMENFGISPDTRRILEGMGHKFTSPQPANHVSAILVGAPSLGGKPVGKNRFYGANDPRRNTGLALGY